MLLVAACPFPCSRGTPARILGQATALAQRGLDVHVVTYHLGDGPPPTDFTTHRIPHVPTYRRLRAGPSPQKLLVLDPLLAIRTLQVARRVRPDVLHGHHVEGGLVGVLVGAMLGVPTVFDAHTSLREELPTYAPSAVAPILRTIAPQLELMLARRCAHTITATEGLRAYLLRDKGGGLSADRVMTIPTSLDTLDFLDSHSVPNRDHAGGHHRIIYTGSLAQFQNVALLREAFTHVREVLPDAELWIVSQDAEIEKEALSGGPGVRHVHVQDLEAEFALLTTADVAVSPRTAPGGLPQKVLNYMRAGLPIVASEGSSDVLRHEHTAWITPNGNVRAMSDALVHLLRHPALCRTLGENAWRDAAVQFGPTRVAEDILAVYRHTLRAHRSRHAG